MSGAATARARALVGRGYRWAAAPLGRRAVRRALEAGLAPELGEAMLALFAPPPAADAVSPRIEARRAALAAAATVYSLAQVTTRSGPARWPIDADPSSVDRPVTSRWIANSASIPPQWGRFLRRCADASPHGIVLELGALAGLSGAYLAHGRGCARLVTIDGSAACVRLATETFAALGIDARIVHASFDDGLDACLAGAGPAAVGLAYVDGHHDGDALRAYVRRITPSLLTGALVVLDDITHNDGMWAAWQAFAAEPGWSTAIHTGRVGVLQWAPDAERPFRLDVSRYTGHWPVRHLTPTGPLPPAAYR